MDYVWIQKMELNLYFYRIYLSCYKFLKFWTLFELIKIKTSGKRKISLFTWAGYQPSPSSWADYPWACSPPGETREARSKAAPAPVADQSGVSRWWGGAERWLEQEGGMWNRFWAWGRMETHWQLSMVAWAWPVRGAAVTWIGGRGGRLQVREATRGDDRAWGRACLTRGQLEKAVCVRPSQWRKRPRWHCGLVGSGDGPLAR
jgi:hypothetical protein